MFHALKNQLGAAAVDRLTLWVNHLLASEPAAAQRLRGHVGRTLELIVESWPAPLPPPPPTLLRVTAAGLVELVEPGEVVAAPDLRVIVDGSNPALTAANALAGRRPRIAISGDAAFAADLDWLIDNLRWDVEDDLARVVGPMPARQIARAGSAGISALRSAAQAIAGFVDRR